MNSETTTQGPEGGFDPHRLRTITDVKRSSDDRLLGGVCAGVADYLNIDPVIVRVVIAVLTIVGFAGAILYAAAWLLLPADDAERSIAAGWFNLDQNEEQFRTVGLVVAGVIAVVALLGDRSFGHWGAPWFLIPLAGLYFLFVVRPRRSRDKKATAAFTAADGDPRLGSRTVAEYTEFKTAQIMEAKLEKARRPRKSKGLPLLTISLIAIGVASTRIYADLHDGVPWTTYVAVALAITGLGLLIGTFFGYGGPLIALGLVLAAALAFGSALPSSKIGAQTERPLTATQVDGTYKHGIGQLELDLTKVSDPDNLLGRTIKLKSGIGQIRVIVPRDLNLTVSASQKAGEFSIFGNTSNDGTDVTMFDTADRPNQPALTIEIDQTFGYVEVIGS